MSDLKRNIEQKIAALLDFFPVVIVLGVRQCGKTTLVKKLKPEWRYFDLERARDFDLVSNDPDLFFREHPHSIIIDEAQKYPPLFEELRGVIDRDRKIKNRFLLTGSSSLELIKNVSETLAGRVAVIELETLKINERYARPLPNFYRIFNQPIQTETIDFLRTLNPEASHDDIMAAFFEGGYPEPVVSRNHRFHQVWMENYLKTYVQRDIRALFPRLDVIKYRRFVHMLAALNGTIINRSQVGRSLDIAEKSIRDYLEIAAGSYIWRNLPSYAASLSKSIIKMPKGNFRDSGLSLFLQNVHKREQLLNSPSVGAAFEAFVTEEIIKGIEALEVANWHYSYFRTKNGAEVDLILEGPFNLLPIEIKFGTTIKQRQLQSLKNFIAQENLPLGIVINNSEQVELLSDRIIQLPVGCI